MLLYTVYPIPIYGCNLIFRIFPRVWKYPFLSHTHWNTISIITTIQFRTLLLSLLLLFCFQVPESIVPTTYQYQNHTLISMTTQSPNAIANQTTVPCKWTCDLADDRGYVVYSALGSFYIPMFVMLFFYWRIYRAAVRTTRAINQGFKTTKGMWTNTKYVNLQLHTVESATSVLRFFTGIKMQWHLKLRG